MQRLEHVRRTAHGYATFQGLRLLPWGIAILTDATLGQASGPYGDWRPFSTLLALALAAWTSWAIGRAYERRWGAVSMHTRTSEAMIAGAFLVTLAVAGSLDARATAPVGLFPLVLGLGLIALAWRLRRTYYAAAGIALLVVASLPAVGVVGQTDAFRATGWLIGLAMLAVAVIDHLTLARAFERIGREAEA